MMTGRTSVFLMFFVTPQGVVGIWHGGAAGTLGSGQPRRHMVLRAQRMSPNWRCGAPNWDDWEPLTYMVYNGKSHWNGWWLGVHPWLWKPPCVIMKFLYMAWLNVVFKSFAFMVANVRPVRRGGVRFRDFCFVSDLVLFLWRVSDSVRWVSCRGNRLWQSQCRNG